MSNAVVIMAKPAVPGQVKTRLIGELTAEQAAAVHRAMWAMTVKRVTHAFADDGDVQLVVALATPTPTTDAAGAASLIELPSQWRVIDQGRGDLGDRLDHVWRGLGQGRILFLGVDSPDVPLAAMRAAWQSTEARDVAIGPVDDGGYWTLACRGYQPALLRGIDWGTGAVYDQTCRIAAACGLSVQRAAAWHDVDDANDLRALRARLATTCEPSLWPLRDALNRICKDA